MATVTITVPDDLLAQLTSLHDRLPELLALSLQQPALPASVYRAIVEFLASAPTPAQVAAFGPTPEMIERLHLLIARAQAGQLTEAEQAELSEFERIEHVMVMIKAGNIPFLSSSV